MGNCQAIDAASLVVQHPSGRVERLYSPVSANEVMKSNPNHCVAMIITSSFADGEKNAANGGGVRVTRVKLLKPADTLVLGHAYRLIDSQEVMKGLWAKKYGKMKKKDVESSTERQNHPVTSEVEATQAATNEKHRQRTTSLKAKQWRPSLQSISEAGLTQQNQKATEKVKSRREGHYDSLDVF